MIRIHQALLVFACAAFASNADAAETAWRSAPDGIVVTPAEGPARSVRLQVMSDRIVHVTALPATGAAVPPSLMVTAQSATQGFTVNTGGDAVSLATGKIAAQVSLHTGAVTFLDAAGKPMLAEYARSFTPTRTDGQPFYTVRQEFNRGTDEGFFGLGQHQNRQTNLNGQDVVLAQHNMDVAVPFVVSTKNYGVLWDNYSITRFGDARPYEALPASLTLSDASGQKGGLTAHYYIGDDLKLERAEREPNYEYIRDQANWPAEVKGVANRRVVWDGKIEAHVSGVHKFRFYVSGYFKLSIDGKVMSEGWRQNWNPWFRNFDLPMNAGEQHVIRIEWTPLDGYIRLFHLDPLPDAERHELSLSSDVAQTIDYYFVAGDNMDDVIAGYRRLTGKSAMLPKWAYGFWQSRQRYKTQQELLDTLAEYRRRQIPLDAIVQDWFYWPEDQWGSHDFDRARFPDPKAMVDQVHAQHAHIMLSVWPKFYPNTKNYRELDAAGHMYHGNIAMGNKDWVGPGYPSSNYDPYSAEARNMYWKRFREKLDVLGFDAWWLDNDEPDIHSNLSIEERMGVMGPTAMGPAAQYFNSFPLMHVGGVHDHWTHDHPDTRAFILTRSGFGGLQRYGAAVWSGDITTRWSDMHDQIPAGMNFSLSGIPNWSFDIGGYTMETRYEHPSPADHAEWIELYTRWFEFGAFVPIFRAHGEVLEREIYNIDPAGGETYNTLVFYDRLRYRLMPYIYTIAADTYLRDGTMMRALVMDFPADRRAWTVDDEYMFGPAFLVAPVTEYKARSRRVYLPAGTRWYDFWTGKAYDGGHDIEADAPLNRMPLFVRAGSIVPTGPVAQHTDEAQPVTVLVYPGANGRFDLYEDDGTTRGYERGAFARTPIAYDDAAGILTIGPRSGEYPSMTRKPVIRVRWMAGKDAAFDTKPDATVTLTGKPIVLRRPR